MSSVTVKKMNLAWLKTNGKLKKKVKVGESEPDELQEKGFHNLVEILGLPKNRAFYETAFVNCLLDLYWNQYKEVIKWNHFTPFMCYLLSMILYIDQMLRSLDQTKSGTFYDHML